MLDHPVVLITLDGNSNVTAPLAVGSILNFNLQERLISILLCNLGTLVWNTMAIDAACTKRRASDVFIFILNMQVVSLQLILDMLIQGVEVLTLVGPVLLHQLLALLFVLLRCVSFLIFKFHEGVVTLLTILRRHNVVLPNFLVSHVFDDDRLQVRGLVISLVVAELVIRLVTTGRKCLVVMDPSMVLV